MIRSIIIEDNDFHRDKLLKLLSGHDDMEVLGHFPHAEAGLKGIRKLRPDLVFLDIEMPPGMTGIEMLAQIPKEERTFNVIFTTQYNEYAVRAIELSCLAYLEKPIDPEKLAAALEKYRSEADREHLLQKYEVLEELLQEMPLGRKPFNLPIGTGKGYRCVRMDEVVHLQAAGSYTEFFFTDNSTLMVSHLLQDWERKLTPYGAVRIHKSHAINLKYVAEYHPSDGGRLLLRWNGQEKCLNVGDTYRSGFEDLFLK